MACHLGFPSGGPLAGRSPGVAFTLLHATHKPPKWAARILFIVAD